MRTTRIVKSCSGSSFAMVLLCTIASTTEAGNAPMIVNAATSGAPAVPKDLKITCTQGPNTTTASTTCPVISWQGHTYWIYSFVDNRVSVAVVEYDENKMPVMQVVKQGTRYPWKVAVDVTAKSVTIWGQSNGTATLTWNELLDPQSPVIMNVGSTTAPARPGDLKVACMQNASSTTPSTTCPVPYWGGYRYWAYSYIDNRNAMAIVAYDAAGGQIMRLDRPGARYVWNVAVSGNVVSFYGQGTGIVTATLSDLRSNVPPTTTSVGMLQPQNTPVTAASTASSR